MTHLFHALLQRVDVWRTGNYYCADYPAILARCGIGADTRWHRYTPDFVIRRADR